MTPVDTSALRALVERLREERPFHTLKNRDLRHEAADTIASLLEEVERLERALREIASAGINDTDHAMNTKHFASVIAFARAALGRSKQ